MSAGKALAALLAVLLAGVQAAPAQESSARVYVRRIELEGVSRTRDDVLRREMLQLEAAYLDTVALERSRRRLQALPYVQSARVMLHPVEGSADLVDIVVTIVEAPARHYGGGGGYSPSQQTSLHLYYIDQNLLGTGQRLSFTAEGSELRSAVELSHLEPRVRGGNVSRALAWSSSEIERLSTEASQLDAALDSFALEYAFPVGRRSSAQESRTEALGRLLGIAPGPAELRPYAELLGALRGPDCCQRFRLGVALRDIELTPGVAVSAQLAEWILGHGDAARGALPGTRISEMGLLAGWLYDTLDAAIFPGRGLEQSVTLRTALPGSDVEYFMLDYDGAWFRPLGEHWTARVKTRLGYGAAYGGETTAFPPYLNWFAGGPSTVRGYRENGLGPRDSRGNAYGGNLLLAAQLEMMTAWPRGWGERVRTGFFFDLGNVFSTEDVVFADDSGARLDYGFEPSALRLSAGVAAEVSLPLGILRLSYAVPLGEEDEHPNRFLRDDIERFQVSIGVGFGS